MNKEKIKKHLKRGIEFLLIQQKKDGNFLSYTFNDLNDKSDYKPKCSVFSASLILSNLNLLGGEYGAKKIQKKIAKFLLSQKSTHNSFNYWVRNSDDFENEPCPDDLDDTFCSFAALFGLDDEYVDEKILVDLLGLLVATEIKEGGPYRTWLATGNEWRDVDLVVNSNVAYFLSLQDVCLDSIVELVERAIEKEEYESQYYSTLYSVIFFISRFYQGSKKDKIVDFLRRQQGENLTWNGNALDTALALFAMINLGVPIGELTVEILNLVSCQQEDGSWELSPFVIEKIEDGRKYHSGSQALSTSFCIALLGIFLKDGGGEKKELLNGFELDEVKEIKNKILRKAKKLTTSLDGEAKKRAIKRIDVLFSRKEGSHIVVLPFYFEKDFSKNKNVFLSEEIIIDLGLAGLFGWLAYEIYDDFIDRECGIEDTVLINFFMREFSFIFYDLSLGDPKYLDFFRSIINKAEESNLWEILNCRIDINDGKLKITDGLPIIEKTLLINRSLGYFLGVAFVLFFLGYDCESDEFKKTHSFFCHYILCRQLNDDMHDWEDDICKGQLSYVVLLIVQKFFEKTKNDTIDLDKDMDQLRGIFWNDVVLDICNEIMSSSSKAKKDILKVIHNEKNFFTKMADEIGGIAKTTVREQNETIRIMNYYKKKRHQ